MGGLTLLFGFWLWGVNPTISVLLLGVLTLLIWVLVTGGSTLPFRFRSWVLTLPLRSCLWGGYVWLLGFAYGGLALPFGFCLWGHFQPQAQPTACILSVLLGFIARFKRPAALKSQHHEHHGTNLGPQFPSRHHTYEVPTPFQNLRYIEVSESEKRRPNCADDAGPPKVSRTLGSVGGSLENTLKNHLNFWPPKKHAFRACKGRGRRLGRHPLKA